nr:hypothetical protein [Sedimentibacter sp.]
MGKDSMEWTNLASKLHSENNNENGFISYLLSLPPKQFSLLSSLIGIALTDNLDANQQNSLGNFLVNVGQVILTAAGQEQLIQNKSQIGQKKLK